MRVAFSFPYNTFVTSEKVEELVRLLGVPPSKILEDSEHHKPHVKEDGSKLLRSYHTFEADADDLIMLNIPIEIKGHASGEVFAQLIAVLHKLERRIPQSDYKSQQFNERVSVHVPGFGLLEMDEVRNVDDECTDRLQELLDDGWRILAICPQPDQRRPDYILGRKKRQ